MILSFVKSDVSAAICKMTEIYIYIYEHEAIRIPNSENNIGAPLAPLSKVYQRYIPLAVLALNCVAS